MELHGTTVYLPMRNLTVDAVLYGPDLESHYIQCIRDFITDKSIKNLKTRPDIQAELDCLYEALKRARENRQASQGAALAAGGCRVASNTRQKSNGWTA